VGPECSLCLESTDAEGLDSVDRTVAGLRIREKAVAVVGLKGRLGRTRMQWVQSIGVFPMIGNRELGVS
jgi:hypothetical protein